MSLLGLLVVAIVFFFLYWCIKNLDIDHGPKKIILNVLLIIAVIFLVWMLIGAAGGVGSIFTRPIR